MLTPGLSLHVSLQWEVASERRERGSLNGMQYLLCQKIWIHKRKRNLRIHLPFRVPVIENLDC